VKLNQAKKFLEEGHNIKLAVTFTRGWQIEDGRKMVHKFLGELGDTVTVRDPAHLLRPRMHHWAVQLSPAATILKKET
jgi:translation initiation factor IF-3